MGVKIFWTVTILLFFTAALFSALHDRLISTEMPSFPRLRQDRLFLPRRFLLFRCDTFDFTAPPSFVVPRYFRFHRDAHFLKH
jgi:hypothetical protein